MPWHAGPDALTQREWPQVVMAPDSLDGNADMACLGHVFSNSATIPLVAKYRSAWMMVW